MSGATGRERSIRVSVRLYACLLIVYPSAFRRDFGREMVQVFHAACCHSAAYGSSGLIRFWFRALADLVASGSAERLSDIRRQSSHRPYLYLGALILSLFTGYLHLRADADVLCVALLLGGACTFGLASPVGAWQWALILGLGIPAALLVGHGTTVPATPHHDGDLPVLAPLIPALLGAYTGTFIRRFLPRLDVSSRSGKQQLL